MAGVKAASVFELYTHERSPQGNMLSLLHSESLISQVEMRVAFRTSCENAASHPCCSKQYKSFNRDHSSFIPVMAVPHAHVMTHQLRLHHGRRPHFTRRQTTRQMIYDIYSTTCCIIQAVSLMSSFTKKPLLS